MNPVNLFLEIFLKYYQKFLCYIFVFIVTPCFFIFEMTVVRPNIIEMYHFGTATQYLHIICPTFCFLNVTGNMFMSILTDTRLKTSHRNGTYCEHCNMHRPARSWHCKTCNACIVRRDHHCSVLSRCIGLYNQRYFVSYLGYIFISMVYSTYYNYFYISAKFEESGLFFSILRICNPMLRFMITEPIGIRDVYLLLLIMNMALVFWSFSMFFYHTSNVFKGVTAYESKSVCLLCLNLSKWKENMVKVFGHKWYLAVLCPFVNSPLPENVRQD